jgi:hypothetical protein
MRIPCLATLVCLLFAVASFAQDVQSPSPSLSDSTHVNDQMQIESTSVETTSSSSSSAGSSGSASANEIVMFPSPNAASMSHAANTNVDLYTGKASVNLPLYTLKSRDIEVPVSLSYSSSGVKVNDYGTWVGQGWNLQAGGAISRVMRGLPDEFRGGIVNSNGVSLQAEGYLHLKQRGVDLNTFESLTPLYQRLVTINASWPTLVSNLVTIPNGTKSADGKDNYSQLLTGAYDTQPDEFYFNFGKYSGKFVFDQDGNIHTVPHYDFSITRINPSQTSIQGFRVTTDEGYVYTFGETETAIERSVPIINTLTTLYMYRYEGENSYTDRFDGLRWQGDWLHEGQSDVSRDYHLYSYPVLRFRDGNILGIGGRYLTYNSPGQTKVYSGVTCTSAWYLKRIQSPSGDFVDFHYVSEGDIRYIQDKSVSVSMPTLPEVSHFKGGSPGMAYYSPIGPVNSDGSSKTISPAGGGEGDPKYHEDQSFSYIVQEIILTGRRLDYILTSTGNRINFTATVNRPDMVDAKRLEGFTVLTNNVYVKSFNFRYQVRSSATSKDVYYLGNEWATVADRNKAHELDTDLDFIRKRSEIAGTDLSSRYNAIFEAEHKRLFLTEVIEQGHNNQRLPSYLFTYNTQALPRRFSTEQDWWGYYNHNTRGTLVPWITYPGAHQVPGVLQHYSLVPWYNKNNASFPGAGAIRDVSLQRTQAGILTAVVLPTGGRKEYIYEGNTTLVNSVNGGVRVREIRTYAQAGVNGFTSETFSYGPGHSLSFYTYNHVKPSELIVNNFRAARGPYHRHQHYDVVKLYTEGTNTYISVPVPGQLITGSSSFSPMYLTKGGHVGYSSVSVSQPGQGRSLYVFSSTPNYAGRVHKAHHGEAFSVVVGDVYPYPQQTDRDYLRGVLISQTDFDQPEPNRPERILKHTSYDYNTTLKANLRGASGGYYMLGFPVNGVWVHNFHLGMYNHLSEWHHLQRVTTEAYDQDEPGNTQRMLTSVTEYTYGGAHHLQPTLITQTQPGGQVLRTHLKYPADFNFGLPTYPFTQMLASLLNKNLKHAVIESYTISGNRTIKGEIISYNFQGKPSHINSLSVGAGLTDYTPMSTNVGSSVSADSRYRQVLSLSYDSHGNVIEKEGEDGVVSAYQYGYGHTLPIAEVSNSRSGASAYVGFGRGELSGWTTNGTVSLDELFLGAGQFLSGSVVKSASTARYRLRLRAWNEFGSSNPVLTVQLNGTTVHTLAIGANKDNYHQLLLTLPEGTSTVRLSTSASIRVDDVGLYPEDAQLSNFEYGPLVGMLASTGPDGRRSRYEYDHFNRLRFVRDHEGNILKRYQYRYGGEDELVGRPSPLWAGFNVGNAVVNQPTHFASQNNNHLIDEGLSEYEWEMGDGTVYANRSSVSHTYSQTGTFTVTLRVRHPEFAMATESRLVTVTQPIQLSLSVEQHTQGGYATATATATGGSGTYTQYIWDTRLVGSHGQTYSWVSQGTTSGPSKSFSNSQSYEIRCTVRDSAGQLSEPAFGYVHVAGTGGPEPIEIE